MDKTKYTYYLKVKKGTIMNRGGSPFELLKNVWLGTNTNPYGLSLDILKKKYNL